LFCSELRHDDVLAREVEHRSRSDVLRAAMDMFWVVGKAVRQVGHCLADVHDVCHSMRNYHSSIFLLWEGGIVG